MNIKDQMKSTALKAMLNRRLKNIGNIQELEIDTKEKQLTISFSIEEVPITFSTSAKYYVITDNSLILSDIKTSHGFILEALNRYSDFTLCFELPSEWIRHL